ncbi:MAG: hypothetical protein MO847_10175, partial [Candidatus Protistobacter heckmanni]|nr:hypothetical protein [Candidatus Protistobacter heckmanni]
MKTSSCRINNENGAKNRTIVLNVCKSLLKSRSVHGDPTVGEGRRHAVFTHIFLVISEMQ